MSRYAPFPVEVSYRIGPTMTKLGKRLEKGSEDSGQLFVVDERYGAYLEQKLRHLSEHPERCGGLSKGTHEGLETALRRVFALVAEEQPPLIRVEGESVRLEALGIALRLEGTSRRGRYTVETFSEAPLSELGQRAKTYLDAQPDLFKLIHALALSIQEDFVILRVDGDIENGDEAECLCVTFPSRWDPQAKVGQNFSEVHAPVANNTALLKAHRPVMNALFHKGPFVRFVWGLSADDSLGQHPEETALPEEVLRSPETLASKLFFRTERQVSYPLPEFGRCLFTVRVSVQPLGEALCNSERRQRLATSLASMDEALLAYKGLSAWREPLLEYLNTHSA